MSDERASQPSEAADVFARYAPPFDLTADLLFTLTVARTAPLRRAFPGVPFLSVLGRTPLLLWFGRVTEVCYRDTTGRPRCDREAADLPYYELTVLAVLRQPALFVPGIYATSQRSVQIGHGYGMPKRPIVMHLETAREHVNSVAVDETRRSFVRARVPGSGRAAARMLAARWPRRSWPVRFPSGSEIRGTIRAVPRIQLALVRKGQLALHAPWLPRTVALLPVGVYLTDLRMELPPPCCRPVTTAGSSATSRSSSSTGTAQATTPSRNDLP